MRRPLFALLALGLALPVVAARAQAPSATDPPPGSSAQSDLFREQQERLLRPRGSGRLARDPRVDDPSVGGKYRGLITTLAVPEDREVYGAFKDWGYWTGASYRSFNNLQPGYWVYANPMWYVWKEMVSDPALRTADHQRIFLTKRAWGPEQATGEPDTLEAGDIQSAWASKTQDDQDEWLELTYANAVSPSAILVHETYNPGALVKVTAQRQGGGDVTVWTGRDPLEPGSGRGVAVVPFRTDFKTNRIRIYLDSKGVSGWNEIDAVGLVDEFGRTQWATGAKASSTYAEGREGEPDVEFFDRGGGRLREVPRDGTVPLTPSIKR